MSDAEHYDGGISRRTLVKSTAIGSLALAAGGISLPFGLKSAAAAVKHAVQPPEDTVVWGACSVNCGSRCALRLHVRDNEVYWVETDNTGEGCVWRSPGARLPARTFYSSPHQSP